MQSKDRIHRVWLKDGKQVKYETHYMHIISNTRSDNKIFDRLQAKFKRMMDVIEHDIPFFNEDVEDEQALMIKEIIEDYQKANM